MNLSSLWAGGWVKVREKVMPTWVENDSPPMELRATRRTETKPARAFRSLGHFRHRTSLSRNQRNLSARHDFSPGHNACPVSQTQAKSESRPNRSTRPAVGWRGIIGNEKCATSPLVVPSRAVAHSTYRSFLPANAACADCTGVPKKLY